MMNRKIYDDGFSGYRHSHRELMATMTSGVLWLGSGTALMFIVRLGVLAVLARLIAPDQFGLFAAAMVCVNSAVSFSQLGFAPGLIQRPNITDRHVSTSVAVTLVGGLGAAFGLVVAAPLMAEFFQMPHLRGLLMVLVLAVPIRGLVLLWEALAFRRLSYRMVAVVDAVSFTIGYAVPAVVMAVAGFGVWALVWGHFGYYILKLIWLIAKQSVALSARFDRSCFRELLSFGGGYTLARVFNQLALEADNLVVGRWLGAAALGFYSRAYQLMVLPARLSGQVLDRVLFPALSRVQDDREALAMAFHRGIFLVSSFVIPVSAVVIVLAPDIILVLLGGEWMPVTRPLQVLSAGIVFRTGYKISIAVCRATGAVYNLSWRQALYAALVFGGAMIGKEWGITGVAAGVLVALFFTYLLMADFVLRIAHVRWGAFLGWHLWGIGLGVVFGAVAVGTKIMLRSLGSSSLVVVTVTGGATAILFGIVCFYLVRVLPNPDGR